MTNNTRVSLSNIIMENWTGSQVYQMVTDETSSSQNKYRNSSSSNNQIVADNLEEGDDTKDLIIEIQIKVLKFNGV